MTRRDTPSAVPPRAAPVPPPSAVPPRAAPVPPRAVPVPPAALALSTPAPSTPLDTDKLYAARLLAVRHRPYLATALFALSPVPSAHVPTMAVDPYWRLYVNAVFVARTPLAELAGVWVHEVSHLLREHHDRGERYVALHGADGPGERLRVNIAADCEINDDVYGDGLAAPRGAVQPAHLHLESGELMEDYLRRFRLGPGTAHLAWLECGSGADGLPRRWDLGPGGADALGRRDRDAVRFRVARALKGAPGSAPAGWQRWAERVVHPPQPWQRLLGAAVRAAATAAGQGADYRYGRPPRRAAALPEAVLPSLRRTPPRVTVVIDTSASVSDAELGSALLELASIARALGGRRDLVKVISCDAAASRATTLCAAADLPLTGGGGTDLRTAFPRALATRPDTLVVLTDGQTPWPAARPPCRTIIGLFPRETAYDEDDDTYTPTGPPAWARVVEIG
ncbi:VWA-like domain-containing protein [Streptomyces sp. NPDC058426]|uniref:vWA domain-containing protein n=1 Tax=Streptomyces sp. NPDC058426 TaxID=3346493 RepID=UPI003664D550